MTAELRQAVGGPVEWRQTATGPGRLSGFVIRWGEVSTGLPFRERFEPDSLRWRAADGLPIVNVQHRRDRPLARIGGGLELERRAAGLFARVELPDTQEARDAAALVRRRVLRGWSPEFVATRERMAAGVRVIEAADLPGIGLVDSGAYPGSTVAARAGDAGVAGLIEVRRRRGRLSGGFAYDRVRTLRDRGQRRKQQFSAGAFRYALDRPDREINLILGDYSKPLASRYAGTLELTDTPDALLFSAPLPASAAGRELADILDSRAALVTVSPLATIPPRDVVPGAVSIAEEENGVQIEVVNEAVLTALALVSRPQWSATQAEADAAAVRLTAGAAPRRRRRVF